MRQCCCVWHISLLCSWLYVSILSAHLWKHASSPTKPSHVISLLPNLHCIIFKTRPNTCRLACLPMLTASKWFAPILIAIGLVKFECNDQLADNCFQPLLYIVGCYNASSVCVRCSLIGICIRLLTLPGEPVVVFTARIIMYSHVLWYRVDMFYIVSLVRDVNMMWMEVLAITVKQ